MNEAFFNAARKAPFRGRLTQKQVDGMQAIFIAWRKHGDGDNRKLAYILATAYHETAATVQAIREYGRGRGRKYGARDTATGHVYYGRGFVQLTWKENYAKAGNELGIDLVNNPDLALRMDIAAEILVRGMMRGWFTRYRLSAFFNDDAADPVGARRIVNGTDRAEAIAVYYRDFLAALTAAEAADARSPGPAIPPPPDIEPAPTATPAPARGNKGAAAGLAALIGAAVGAILKYLGVF